MEVVIFGSTGRANRILQVAGYHLKYDKKEWTQSKKIGNVVIRTTIKAEMAEHSLAISSKLFRLPYNFCYQLIPPTGKQCDKWFSEQTFKPFGPTAFTIHP